MTDPSDERPTPDDGAGRLKTGPSKDDIARRLKRVRVERFGDGDGAADLARLLGVPLRTWLNYESGFTTPAEVMLRFVELTGAEPRWLLRGEGPTYRSRAAYPGILHGHCVDA